MSLEKKLCVNFCPYYKPSKDEGLACLGFLLVERLIKFGKKISFEKVNNKLDDVTEKKLRKHVCTACSFYEDDCDFSARKENATPCGGFMLLGHLLNTNVISIDDLKGGESIGKRSGL